MIPAPFEYVRPTSAGDALDLLAEHGDEAKLLAGGHSLLPMMKLRLAVPSVLIDIGRSTELASIRVDGDDLAIGATTRHADVAGSDAGPCRRPRCWRSSAAQVGDPQIRHRGTIGGSLAHADPAADLPMAAARAGRLDGADGTGRDSARCQWTTSSSATSRPRWSRTRCSPRSGSPGARTSPGATRSSPAGPTTGPSSASPPWPDGSRWPTWAAPRCGPRRRKQALASGAAVAEAAVLAAEGTEPGEDIHADQEYRQHLARVLTERALQHQTG